MEELKKRIKEINERVDEISKISDIYDLNDKEFLNSIVLEINDYREELKLIIDEKLKRRDTENKKVDELK